MITMKYNQKVTINTWFYEGQEWVVTEREIDIRTNGNLIIEEITYQVVLGNLHICRDMFRDDQLTVIT